jgi:hypothetical protein
VEDPKPSKTKKTKGDSERKCKPLPAETRLFASHWPAILQEMNKLLAQEED